MEERVKSIKLLIFIGGVIPSIMIALFVFLEPHLLRMMGVLLAGYLVLFVALTFFMLSGRFSLERIEFFKNISISLCSVLIILIVTELTFYYEYRDKSIGAKDTPSGMTFYPKYYKTNRFGFRDREFDLSPPPTSTKRIMVIGDSFTFGMGIKKGEDTYPKVLENLLKDLSINKNFEVINAGMKGYDTSQEFFLLKTIGIALKPDLVILGYYLNDTDIDKYEIPILGIEPHFLKAIDKILLQHLFSWYIIRTKLLPDLGKINKEYLTYITSKESLKKHEEVFKELVNFLEKRDIPLIVLILPPSCYEKTKSEFDDKLMAHIRMLCDKYELMFIDLAPVMEVMMKQYNCRELMANKYDSHPSEIVHEVYAREIFNYLLNEYFHY